MKTAAEKRKAVGAKGIALFVLLAALLFFFLKPHQQQISAENQFSQLEVLETIADNIVSGGPPKDGIPALTKPNAISREEAEDFLKDDDIVFGIAYNGFVRAYPQKIMYWHEIVNEDIDGQKVSITFCPLTGSVIGYFGHFGVSGGLYNSNLVMYDKETESLWPQMLGQAVTGSRKGEKLMTIPVAVTIWKKWKALHSETTVISPNTGYDRNYNRNPYPGYEDFLRLWFPVAAESNLFSSKKWIVGIEHNGDYLAIPKEAVHDEMNITLGDDELSVKKTSLNTIEVTAKGKRVHSFEVYWFAWYAYHPRTKVLSPDVIKRSKSG